MGGRWAIVGDGRRERVIRMSGGRAILVWGDFMADYEGMIAEITTVKGHNGDAISAYFARPLGPGPFPGVVLIHHAPGWDEWYREATRKFAHHGYLAISPNLYEREGSGSADDVAAAVRAAGGVADEQAVGDIVGSMQFLRALPQTNGKVGVFGTCSGGRQAYLAGCAGGFNPDARFDAVVNCWGGRVVMTDDEKSEKMPVAPIDYTPNLSAPILGLFGNDDMNPTPAHVNALEEALKEHGKDYEFHRYDGAGHGFFYHDRPNYRIEQALDGWEKLFHFFGQHLSA